MLFVDTWGWVALHNKRETKHDEVKAFMKELGVKDIVTGDEHFEHVGMGFQCKP